MRFRPRYSLRTLLVLVTLLAVAAGSLALKMRSDRLYDTYVSHKTTAEEYVCILPPVYVPGEDEWREYHKVMAEKYLRASRRPWLPVEPDPPAPPDPF